MMSSPSATLCPETLSVVKIDLLSSPLLALASLLPPVLLRLCSWLPFPAEVCLVSLERSGDEAEVESGSSSGAAEPKVSSEPPASRTTNLPVYTTHQVKHR